MHIFINYFPALIILGIAGIIIFFICLKFVWKQKDYTINDIIGDEHIEYIITDDAEQALNFAKYWDDAIKYINYSNWDFILIIKKYKYIENINAPVNYYHEYIELNKRYSKKQIQEILETRLKQAIEALECEVDE